MFAQSTFRPQMKQGFLPSVQMAGLQPQPQGFYGGARLLSAPPVMLGQDSQTAQSWYERAKKAIDRYKFLQSRLETIANKTERENIKTWLGAVNVPGTPQYRYNSVVSDFTSDVASEGVGAYNVTRRQDRVAQLEVINDEFDAKVKFAIKTYGELPPAQVITQPGTQTAAPSLTTPLLVAGGAIALAILLS